MRFQRYAVIGSNSYAGAAFVSRAISDGADIIGFNRSKVVSDIFLPHRKPHSSGNYRFFQADINCDLDVIMKCLDDFKPQVVVDFAGQGMVAESWQSPEQWYLTNIVSKVRLHDQLRRRDWLLRYIRISTPEVYGSQDSLADESWIYNPSTPYAVSHAAIDMSLRSFHQQYDFPVIFTRFANFYGPGQQLYRIVPRTIIYALLGKKLKLHGGGRSIRAFIYGDDVADGIMRALNGGNIGEVYHFSPERFLTIRQVVEIICQQLNFNFDSVAELAPERPAKDLAYLMSSSKARNTLDWTESLSFEQGINNTIDWVKLSLDEIQNLPLNYIHKT
jgi:dTDP-glucose 4,6-dehydratase